ncbi:unnamed protein product [Sphagnum troendelagicum]|uniref:ABC transporter domain-containing protein n=1 Tax=Sphagnum troendelagicum TaxID=128251 RepID=A0ABP0UPZ2_9BRYO
MTLLLGPPGSGKTSLLLALTAKLDKALKVRGEVTYNGHKLHEFVPQKTSTYISQRDLHLGEMTVRETLNFSARCQGVGYRYQLLSEIHKREKEAGIEIDPELDFFMKAQSVAGVESSIATDYTLRILGLEVCAETLIGDNMRRGISGGQRKRVTTGEMLVGPSAALFMDEISTGLDSSTTFQIINCLSQIVHVLEGTILVSLLQPAPETYQLFDDIILLSEGVVVYQGPCDKVEEFFDSCGFKCPPRKGIADFLQEVTSQKDQKQYWADTSKPYCYVSIHEFANAFNTFHVGIKLKEELGVKFPRHKSHTAALAHSHYSVSMKELLQANFANQILLMKRNSTYYVFKSGQIALVAFISMTTFIRTRLHQETINDGLSYMGCLFFTITVLMFNGFGELALIINRLPVFFKQRDLLFYPAWTFSLPIFVLGVPITLFECGIWVLMTYFVTGYAPEAQRFFRQYLLLVCTQQMSAALFRAIAAVCQTMILANTVGFILLLIIFMMGGFVIPKTDIQKWWIWAYWISPLMYADNAAFVNEFKADRWAKIWLQMYAGNVTLGDAILIFRAIHTQSYWYWIGVGALIGFAIFFNLVFTAALHYLNSRNTPQAIVSEETLEAMRKSTKSDSFKGLHCFSSFREWQASNPYPLSKKERTSVSETHENTHHHYPDTEEALSFGGSLKQKLLQRGMILPFQKLSITFDDITYSVDVPQAMKTEKVEVQRLQLLSNVSGTFRPGILTALVGVSGAGKTTLMDVLAGRKTGGHITGDIRISGYPKSQKTFARICGYCEQNDIHSPQVTVMESLVYSAWLRLAAEIDSTQRMKFVEEVMELVELVPLQNALVGLPGQSGLSTEQRKRLTIAVELVANPSIIFMDEPTSGLDARAAAIVMRTVRNTVNTGRTVVCTIHQPSIEIFEAFDELLLMKRGGQVIYMGPLGHHSQLLIEYFEALPGVTKMKEGYNPATWVLEVSSITMEQQIGVDFAQVYKSSSLYQRNKALVKELSVPRPNSKDLFFPSMYSQSTLSQFTSCLWKQHLTYWRSPGYNLVRIVFTLATAIIFGSVFWKVGSKRDTSSNILTCLGAMYSATTFIASNSCGTVQPVVSIERTVFYREKAAGMYSPLPYAFAQVVIEIPYVFVQTLVYTLITYAMLFFEWTATKFLWYFYCVFCLIIGFAYYGMMMVALTANEQLATIAATFFYSVFNLYAGFMIPLPEIPKWWSWYYWICPTSWTVYGLVTSQFGNVQSLLLDTGGPVPPTVEQYVNNYFGYSYSFLGVVGGMLLFWPLLFATVFAFAIKFINFQNR